MRSQNFHFRMHIGSKTTKIDILTWEFLVGIHNCSFMILQNLAKHLPVRSSFFKCWVLFFQLDCWYEPAMTGPRLLPVYMMSVPVRTETPGVDAGRYRYRPVSVQLADRKKRIMNKSAALTFKPLKTSRKKLLKINF